MILDKKIIENTLVDFPRLDRLVDFSRDTNAVTGAVVEVGVYKGGTARLLCVYNPYKHVFLFDTFKGMPPSAPLLDQHKEGVFSDTSLPYVRGVLSDLDNYSLYRGVFPKENSEYVDFLTFCLVHIDVDIYSSVKECLEFFHQKMAKGGIIVLDDYGAEDCPGAKLATDEFCKKNNLFINPGAQCQVYLQY